MTTKKILYGFALLSFSTAVIFTSCKKKETEKTEEQTTVATPPDGQSGTDSREVQGENDAATSEINDVISNTPRVGGKGQGITGTMGVCGFDVDSVKISHDTLVFKYNGITCNTARVPGSSGLAGNMVLNGKTLAP